MKLGGSNTIRPYSAIQETGANVPCLKHFFRCHETSGVIWSDSKGGVVIRPTAIEDSLAFDTTLKTVDPTMFTSSPLNAGAWATCPAGYSILNFAVVRTTHSGDPVPGSGLYDAFRMPVGIGASSDGITSAIYGVGTHLLVGDGIASTRPNEPTPGSVTIANGTDCMIREIYIPGVTIEMKAYTTSGALITSLSGVPDAAIGAITPGLRSRPSGAKFYGWAVFYFKNGIPPDIDAITKWMMASWMAGKRFICPSLIGLV